MNATETRAAQRMAELNGYTDVCEKPEHGLCAIYRYMYTYAILSDINDWGFGNRWCYCSYTDAKAALDAWEGGEGTEPTGWHRHPDTGRRFDRETGKMTVFR